MRNQIFMWVCFSYLCFHCLAFATFFNPWGWKDRAECRGAQRRGRGRCLGRGQARMKDIPRTTGARMRQQCVKCRPVSPRVNKVSTWGNAADCGQGFLDCLLACLHYISDGLEDEALIHWFLLVTQDNAWRKEGWWGSFMIFKFPTILAGLESPLKRMSELCRNCGIWGVGLLHVEAHALNKNTMSTVISAIHSLWWCYCHSCQIFTDPSCRDPCDHCCPICRQFMWFHFIRS